MLTEKAMYERMWGQFPMLGKILGTKQIPDHYFGYSSISDNVFDRIHRLMKISILIRENSDEIKIQLRSPELEEKVRRELHGVTKALEYVARQFHEESLEVANGFQ